jgi:hypothetical protein
MARCSYEVLKSSREIRCVSVELNTDFFQGSPPSSSSGSTSLKMETDEISEALVLTQC